MTEEEEQNLREKVEYGHRARIVKAFLNDFLLLERANVIGQIENGAYSETKELENFACYLQTLKKFELNTKMYITTGDISEKELNKSGK